jgi:exodeoxyribonuclease-3
VRVFTFNINGFRSASGKGLLAWLSRQEADVICLQEVRAQEHQLPPILIELAGYRAHWLCAERKGYSGVGLLLRDKPDRLVCGMEDPELDREGRLLRADFGRLSICSLYVPSGITGAERQQHKMVFLNRLLDHFTRLRDAGRELLICGDFNIAHRPIDLAHPERNERTSGFFPEERAWMDRLIERGLVDVFRRVVGDVPEQYTWWTAWNKKYDRGWRLDYQMATPAVAETARAARIYKDTAFSDHAPVSIDYDWQLKPA